MQSFVQLASRKLTGGVFLDVPILHNPLSRFFVQAVFIITICRGLSIIAYPLKQPSVIFEIIGGILMGPSAFGRDPYYLEVMFQHDSLHNIQLVAEIGLVLYLFMVGLELDPKLLMSHAKSAGGIAVIGMMVPFGLGIAISWVMFDNLQGDDPAYANVSHTSFFVFVGTAMSITAFPVLARILKEGGLIYTKAGSMAMGAAALNDAIAWCLLILAVSMANSGDMSVAGKVFASVFALGVGLFAVFRPIFEKLVDYLESQNSTVVDGHLFALTLCFCLLCAWTTDLLGVDAIFGSFMFGLCVPRGTRLFHTCEERIEQFVLTFTLPLYFALSGLKTDVTQIRTGKEGAMVVLVCVVASFGKFIGAGGTALVGGMSIRESAAIAALMNTRGLVELIVLNLGLQSGILNGKTFTVLVLMALFTTFLTCPLINWIYPEKYHTRHGVDVQEKGAAYGSVTGSETREITSICKNFDTSRVSKDTRIGLIVDKLEYMQCLIKVLSCFLPFDKESGLATTVMHFIEPTHTKHDEFLALNDEGRLIRVDEETTDIAIALRDAHDPALKKPELLPVSMFCKGMQTQVKAFRIQGDPDEFPIELRSLSKHNECSLILVPWRDSVYLQTLFWSSLEIVHSAAFILVVEKNPKLVMSAISTVGRGRSMSQQPIDAPGMRQRSGSFFQKMGFAETDEEHVEEGVQMYSNIVEKSARRPTMVHSLPALPPVTRLSSVVVSVLTGSESDVTTLLVLLRFAENRSVSVHVLLPKDYEAFSDLILTALASFKKRVADMSHVEFVTMNVISTDHKGIVHCVHDYEVDYVIASFVAPSEADMAKDQWTAVASEQSNDAHHYQHVDGVHHIPARYRGTSMTHPEFGVLGCALYASTYTSRDYKLLIVHHGGLVVGHGGEHLKTPSEQLLDEHLMRSKAVTTISSSEVKVQEVSESSLV